MTKQAINIKSNQSVGASDLLSGINDLKIDIRPNNKLDVFAFPNGLPAEQRVYPMVDKIFKECSKYYKEEIDFKIAIEGIPFRVNRIDSVDGTSLMIRKISTNIWDLDNLSLPKAIHRQVVSKQLNSGGLILVVGSLGQGKSTTMAAITKKRLLMHGGLCITVEDPPEGKLQGSYPIGDNLHGEKQWAHCIQQEIKDSHTDAQSFSKSIKRTLRSYPSGLNQSMLMIGEVRDPDSAAMALQSAVDGRLVLTTVHGARVHEGLQRLCLLAAAKIGLPAARDTLSSAFRVGIHQKLIVKQESKKIEPEFECLVGTQQVYGRIRDASKDLGGLHQEIMEQQTYLKQGLPIKLRSQK